MSGTITRIFGDSVINAKTSKEDFDIIKHSGKEVRYKAEGKHIFEEWGGGGGDDLEYDFVPFIQIEKDDNVFKINSQSEYKELSKAINKNDYRKIANTKLNFTKEALSQKEIALKFSIKQGNEEAKDSDGYIYVKYTTIKGYTFSDKKNTLDQSLGIKKYGDTIEIKNTPEFFKPIESIDFYFKDNANDWLDKEGGITTKENCGRITIEKGVLLISMTFEGAVNSKNIKQADGWLNIISNYEDGSFETMDSFQAVGGPWGNGSPENGKYKVNSLLDRGPNSWYNEGMTRDGIGFSLNVEPEFKTWRTDIRIHPDGGKFFGTQGCIGLLEKRERLKKFKLIVEAYLKKQKNIQLIININGNPNNNGKHSKIKNNGE